MEHDFTHPTDAGAGTHPTYASLKAQAQSLLQQAEALRQNEIAQTVLEIKERMRAYGLTAADLEDRRPQASGRSKRGGQKIARFRGPTGELWSGGPGRKPEWVRNVLAQGGDIEQYRIAA